MHAATDMSNETATRLALAAVIMSTVRKEYLDADAYLWWGYAEGAAKVTLSHAALRQCVRGAAHPNAEVAASYKRDADEIVAFLAQAQD